MNLTTKIKGEVKVGAWYSAATQITKLARKPLVAALRTQGANQAQLKSLGAFLDTPTGLAVLSLLLGVLLESVSGIEEDEDEDEEYSRIAILAEYLRIIGLQNIIDVLAEPLLEPLRSQLTKLVSKLPA